MSEAGTAQGSMPTIGEVTWLKGIRVVEITTAVSAPLIGRVLGEMGAEIIKVESRAKVDVNRARVPRPTDPKGFPAHEAFQLLHEANAGKESVTLNLKTERGRALFLEVLGDADVFIENFVPGWLDRLELPVEVLREKFPRLIILSASGYGQTGPLRTQRAYAPVMTALAGVEGLIGYADGQVMGCSALALADLNCTFNGVFLVMAALAGRQVSGEGVHLDLSQIEAATVMAGEAFVEQQLGLKEPGPVGNREPDGTPWTVQPTAEEDSWVASRGEHLVTSSHNRRPNRHELLDRLRSQGVETSPVLSPLQVVSDGRFVARGFTQNVVHPHPMIGQLTITSVPWRLDGIVPRVTAAAPLIGSSNASVLGRYAGKQELEELEAEGVLR
ncbi:CaiB/BaiF CoA transferase family protein [Pseudarthrobacter sulfonivorans]|uniref:CaiB/BaiF CoA transferase family protein n=1 Tax=Pseudarthrobacter sulfonivorans TaxID=121292 RepID=UPI0027885594|nr:CoA transferase [Pseudarthrobacter sulfonivorans]MDP9998453.1 crotonobetainyl-CoA:carnitine CoA-transferase CaiB-like acyl-CoA transferase [Pseudarthrobacter sulfonivorans]